MYNDIKFHGECGGGDKEYKNTHAIFFVDEPAIISTALNTMFVQISEPNNPQKPQDALNQVDLSNNTDPDWLDAWYPTTTQIEDGDMQNEDTDENKSERTSIIRDFTKNKVNRGGIFRNELGTTMGPGA